MVKRYIKVLKRIWRLWFIILIVVIIVVAFYNLLAAIILTIITLILFITSYIPSLFFKSRVLRYLKGYYRITQDEINQHFDDKQEKIRKVLFELFQNQADKDWLVILINNSYIFYNSDIVEKYKEFYEKGYGEKKIFTLLQKVNMETRAEVKAIQNTLKNNDRL
ncbi:MAG: hypothetical protein EU541_07925 [Promethearchaeota archaeon]|nr:MAG: hypothetical protein EU541_07925 [Candidatus Lokiarchaeota archaeon]